jgi:hypothetical protein
MRERRVLLLLLFTMLLLAMVFATAAAAQDDDSQPSLGDVARQARMQKQKDAQVQTKDATTNAAQTKDTQSKDAPSKDAQPIAASALGKDSAKDSDTSSKAAQSKDASAKVVLVKGSKKVVTNDEIPEHVGPTSTLPVTVKAPGAPDPPPNYEPGKVPADYVKNQILQMKQYISNLESSIQDLTDSIRYSGGSCVSNCTQWNAQQQQKQQQVESMTSQLAQMQKTLEATQEMARKQGYNSAIYDP